jgi:RimJ/RimL family protein N-acetyltransferase
MPPCYGVKMVPERLKTTRLMLRPFSVADAHAVFSYWQSDPGWERYNASVPSDFSERDAQAFVTEVCARSREDSASWAVVHRETVVGIVSMTFEQNHRIAVIGYGIHGDLRGRGLSAEAARVVLEHAFAAYPQLRRVRAHTDADNSASIGVLMKLGFSREGTLRRNQFVKNEFRDEVVFGLLREEWIA